MTSFNLGTFEIGGVNIDHLEELSIFEICQKIFESYYNKFFIRWNHTDDLIRQNMKGVPRMFCYSLQTNETSWSAKRNQKSPYRAI